jgi:hypothetical protein
MELVPPAFQLTNTISEMSNPILFNPMRKSVGLYLLGHLSNNFFGRTCFLKIAIQKSGGTKTVISL